MCFRLSSNIVYKKIINIQGHLLITNYFIIFCILSFVAAAYDFVFYRIPNIIVLLILVLLVFKISLTGIKEELVTSLYIALLSLSIGYIFYLLKSIGAGDAKFLAVSLAWIPVEQILFYLVIVSLLGGVLAICYSFIPRIINSLRLKIYNFLKSNSMGNCAFLKSYLNQPFNHTQHKSWRKISIPYGLSIAIGNILTILLPFFQEKFK